MPKDMLCFMWLIQDGIIQDLLFKNTHRKLLKQSYSEPWRKLVWSKTGKQATTTDVEGQTKELAHLVKLVYTLFLLVLSHHVIYNFTIYSKAISIDLRSNLCEGKGVFITEGHEIKSQSIDPKDEIRYAFILNKVLPPEIRVIGWAPIDPSMSSRFDCQHRIYHYYFPKTDLNIEV